MNEFTISDNEFWISFLWIFTNFFLLILSKQKFLLLAKRAEYFEVLVGSIFLFTKTNISKKATKYVSRIKVCKIWS